MPTSYHPQTHISSLYSHSLEQHERSMQLASNRPRARNHVDSLPFQTHVPPALPQNDRPRVEVIPSLTIPYSVPLLFSKSSSFGVHQSARDICIQHPRSREDHAMSPPRDPFDDFRRSYATSDVDPSSHRQSTHMDSSAPSYPSESHAVDMPDQIREGHWSHLLERSAVPNTNKPNSTQANHVHNLPPSYARLPLPRADRQPNVYSHYMTYSPPSPYISAPFGHNQSEHAAASPLNHTVPEYMTTASTAIAPCYVLPGRRTGITKFFKPSIGVGFIIDDKPYEVSNLEGMLQRLRALSSLLLTPGRM